MTDRLMIRLGGVSGIALGAVQLAGIVMHGSIPADPAEALRFVHAHPVWTLTHILLIASYLVVVTFYVGLGASFLRRSVLVPIGERLTLLGAILGAIHFMIHLAIFTHLARVYDSAAGTSLGDRAITLYTAAHHYAHVLNRLSVFTLMLVAILFAFAMLLEPLYKKWIGWLGIAGAGTTLAGMLVVELFLSRKVGDIVFAIALMPTIGWLVAVGIVMLRLRDAATPGVPAVLAPPRAVGG